MAKTDTPGVNWVESQNRFKATIYYSGRLRYLGMFKEYEDAVVARQQAERDKELQQLLIDIEFKTEKLNRLRERLRELTDEVSFM